MTRIAIDRERWAHLGAADQMGNIGSEVGRAIDATRRGDADHADDEIDRALDLIDATIRCLVEQRSPRTREVLCAREEFLRLFYDGTFETDAEAIESYFMFFACAARSRTLAARGRGARGRDESHDDAGC